MADATTVTPGDRSSSGNKGGTKLSVLHRTTFHYGGPVSRSENTLRLEPRTFPLQKTISATIRVVPATRLQRFTDLFQNVTHRFELPDTHSKLEIESHIKVWSLPLELNDESLSATLADYRDTEIRERTWPYMQQTQRVDIRPDIWRQAVDLTDDLLPMHDKAFAIMSWIHNEFTYQPGSTAVHTHTIEAYKMRTGVCQDFAHVMLAMCRCVGIPARYASGYLYNGPTGTLVGAQASHAWCEVYLPGAGWIGYDPTNNNLADDRYVKVAVGRDYDDVAPVEGTYHGSGNCHLEVVVAVEKL